MIPQLLRIGASERVERVMKKGARFTTSIFSIWMAPNSCAHPRFACIAPKKQYKTAASRNRIRRQMYEAVRLNINALKGACYDIVIMTRPRTPPKTYQDMSIDIGTLLHKIASHG